MSTTEKSIDFNEMELNTADLTLTFLRHVDDIWLFIFIFIHHNVAIKKRIIINNTIDLI